MFDVCKRLYLRPNLILSVLYLFNQKPEQSESCEQSHAKVLMKLAIY